MGRKAKLKMVREAVLGDDKTVIIIPYDSAEDVLIAVLGNDDLDDVVTAEELPGELTIVLQVRKALERRRMHRNSDIPPPYVPAVPWVPAETSGGGAEK